MKTTCPHCGKRFTPDPAAQRKGGRNRWAGTTAAQRSEAGRRAVLKRWAKRDPARAIKLIEKIQAKIMDAYFAERAEEKLKQP